MNDSARPAQRDAGRGGAWAKAPAISYSPSGSAGCRPRPRSNDARSATSPWPTAATEHSDYDVYVVLRQHTARWPTTRTRELDTIVMSLDELADTSNLWQRYSYRDARVLLDRLDGRTDLARLDELEAAPWFLWTLFALHGRIRPYNKFLRWELDNHPLPAPWTADHLVEALTERPSTLFPELERLAREKGFGDVLDEWADLDLLRVSR